MMIKAVPPEDRDDVFATGSGEDEAVLLAYSFDEATQKAVESYAKGILEKYRDVVEEDCSGDCRREVLEKYRKFIGNDVGDALQAEEAERPEEPLSVILEEADGQVFAHCLEFEIIGYGPTKEEAVSILSRLMTHHLSFLQQHTEFNGPRPAPPQFFEAYAQAQPVAVVPSEGTTPIARLFRVREMRGKKDRPGYQAGD